MLRLTATILSISLLALACSEEPAPVKKPDVSASQDIADTTVEDTASADAATILPAPATSSVTLQSGDGSLEINLDRHDLVLRRAGTWRTRIELKRLRIGRTGRFDLDLAYNPGEHVDSDDPKIADLPEKFAWLTVTDAQFVPFDTTPPAPRPDSVPVPACDPTEGVSLRLKTIDADSKAGPDVQLDLRSMDCHPPKELSPGAPPPQLDGVFQAELYLADPGLRARAASADTLKGDDLIDLPIWTDIAVTVDREERFFGLGELFDTPQHRGKARPMQIQAQLSLESGYNEVHVPVPLVIGGGGWGLFVESRHPATFDCGLQDPDRVHARFASVDLRFWLFAAPSAVEVTGRYTRVSGAPTMPAPWAFGGLIWRNENKDDAEVLDDMAQIRKHGLAVSGMWIDRPYDTHVNNFEFDPARFKDADAMLQKVRESGFRAALWSTPYVEEGGKYRKTFQDNGWMVKVPAIAKQFLKWGGPVDLSNDGAKQFWKQLIGKMTKRGIEGWKLDFGEDTHVGLFGVRAHYSFANGQTERTMHHAYPLYYHAPYFETLPGKDAGSMLQGGFILARAGTYGGQTLASVIWPGDLDATLGEHGDCVGDTCHVAGMAGAVAAIQSLAASGYPLFGSDTGGYRHKRADKVTFLRWLGHTALSPILQLGGSKQHNPWDFKKYGDSEFDQEVLDAAVAWTRLHIRLFPYLYTLARDAHEHRVGPVRGFSMSHPELRQHTPVREAFDTWADSQYWLGDALLVAPIMDSTDRRTVVLPVVHLRDWWTRERVSGVTLAGPATPTVIKPKLPLDKTPLYVREGAILPLLRDSVVTLAPAADKTVDSFANDAGRLHALYVPGGGKSERRVYDGTKLGAEIKGKAINLAVTPGEVFSKGVQWEIWAKTAVKAVAIGTAPAEKTTAAKAKDCVGCWWHEGGTVFVRLPPGQQTAAILFEKGIQ